MVETFQIGTHNLKLETDPLIFRPNHTTEALYLGGMPFEGKTVLDLGTGIGPIGIAAALSGANSVVGIDVMPDACALAQRNACLNGVDAVYKAECGSLFATLGDRRFDIIVCGLSQMAEEVARMTPWYPKTIPTGGKNGAAVTSDAIRESREHLTSGGRLIFALASLATHKIVDAAAREAFAHVLQISERHFPFPKEMYSHIETLKKLRSEGIIDFTERGSRFVWTLWILEARN